MSIPSRTSWNHCLASLYLLLTCLALPFFVALSPAYSQCPPCGCPTSPKKGNPNAEAYKAVENYFRNRAGLGEPTYIDPTFRDEVFGLPNSWPGDDGKDTVVTVPGGPPPELPWLKERRERRVRMSDRARRMKVLLKKAEEAHKKTEEARKKKEDAEYSQHWADEFLYHSRAWSISKETKEWYLQQFFEKTKDTVF